MLTEDAPSGAGALYVIEQAMLRSIPPGLTEADVRSFFARNSEALAQILEQALDAHRARRAPAVKPPTTPAARTRANLAAMKLLTKAVGDITPADVRVLQAYTGWGGLSIDKIREQVPDGVPVPEKRGLIHEYYTDSQITDDVAKFVRQVAGQLPTFKGKVLTLEPSAGIGRFLHSIQGIPQLQTHAVEYSAVSGALLQRLFALNPSVDVHLGSFEAFVAEHEDALRGRLGLVLSNPPYGPRGKSKVEDPNREYRLKHAYQYFLLRCLDLLAAGGLGVFLVPQGFLTGGSNRELRQRVLSRHHLAAAFRLPSGIFPGAMLVTDLLLFRARGGTLGKPLDEDAFIVDGAYYDSFPEHILGEEVGADKGGDDTTKTPRWGYQVVGDYPGLPAFTERPICVTCPIEADPAPTTKRKRKASSRKASVSDAQQAHQDAAQRLGARVSEYLGEASKGTRRAGQLHAELYQALQSWKEHRGNPHRDRVLAPIAKLGPVVALRSAFTKAGEVLEGLKAAPAYHSPYNGTADDVLAQAEYLYKTHREVTPRQLLRFHRAQGGTIASKQEIIKALLLCQDEEDGWHECWAIDPRDVSPVLMPMRDYLTGNLWPRFDRLKDLADTQIGKRQRVRLLEAIQPAVFEDIVDGISPRDGWLPRGAISGWLTETYGRGDTIIIERREGLNQVKGVEYEDLRDSLQREARWFVGWLNHDRLTFNPRAKKNSDETADDVRLRIAAAWTKSFRAWCSRDERRQQLLEDAYNRHFKGFVAPDDDTTPRRLGRWDYGTITPHAHQYAGANRLSLNGGGLLAFDVGVGKTFTGLHALAAAREDGVASRPVILVPNSIVWKWAKDIDKVLPDYSYVVIGSEMRERRVKGGGKRMVSVTDSPAERAAKWARFQAGEVDVALVTYSAFPRTQLKEETVAYFAETVSQIKANVALRKAREDGKKGKKGKSERQEAVDEETTEGWLAERLELPKGWEPDPGIFWEDLGVDFLMVDEAQNFKNLWMPDAREGGVPRFMGGGGDGSKRAWHLDIRCRVVRKHTGGRGIVLLSATPAKNSPLEFYNLLQYIDGDVWERMGIHDSEAFISRYCELAMRQVVTGQGDIQDRSAVVGFQHLDELREVLFRYGTFKTAEDVGLVLPEPAVQLVEVDMSAAQESKYEEYVAAIEEAVANGDNTKTLGFLARMGMVAIHDQLDEGFTWKTADEVDAPSSPKFERLAYNVMNACNHGHIVFVDNVAAHKWVKATLVKAGMAEDRIAILNSKTASPAQRQRIAERFNGNPAEGKEPEFDVVIANAVAYEGIDLQVRTCAIHHLDLPWEPATLQQRNGRGVRQGNTLGNIKIYYYFARRSMDGLRYNLIQGKRGWMTAVLESQSRSTNNPGAQSDLSQEEVLLLISRDPEKTRERLEKVKAEKASKARHKRALAACKLVRAAAGRFRRARGVAEEELATRLRAEGEELVRELLQTDRASYPWAEAAARIVRERTPLVIEPKTHTDPVLPPLYEGLRLRLEGLSGRAEFWEIGKFDDEHITLRQGGTQYWNKRAADFVTSRIGTVTPADFNPTDWPSDPSPTEGPVRWSPSYNWADSVMAGASDVWLTEHWTALAQVTADLFARSYDSQREIPVISEGRVELMTWHAAGKAGADVLVPPTAAGLARLVELARGHGDRLKWKQLNDACQLWFWGRRFPKGVLTPDGAETSA